MGALAVRLSIAAIRVYKLTLSPRLGCSCRFRPTCSEYARQALLEHGFIRGWTLARRRYDRCLPGHGWGYDPVPRVADPAS